MHLPEVIPDPVADEQDISAVPVSAIPFMVAPTATT